ncbi:MAG: MoxR family ATPase [Acidobacteriota bacterium]
MNNVQTQKPNQLDEAAVEQTLERLQSLEAEVAKIVVGQTETVRHLTTALLAGGHALLEGVPGLAKTLMVRTLADAVDLGFKRIQFTPDLMPSDVVGTEVLEEDHGTGRRQFRFQPGPIFSHLVLADEINRSPPKTQAALLEAMQEQAVTTAGETRSLPSPFFVLATQNPIEQAGTYPLPEAQLDRFLIQIRVDYPSADEELDILRRTTGSATAEVAPVLSAADIEQARRLTRQVHLSEPLLAWTRDLVRATRPETSTSSAVREKIDWGAGPRAGQALVLTAKARALLAGRFSVVYEDLLSLVPAILRHRLVLSFRAQAERIDPDEIIADLVQALGPPSSPLEA